MLRRSAGRRDVNYAGHNVMQTLHIGEGHMCTPAPTWRDRDLNTARSGPSGGPDARLRSVAALQIPRIGHERPVPGPNPASAARGPRRYRPSGPVRPTHTPRKTAKKAIASLRNRRSACLHWPPQDRKRSKAPAPKHPPRRTLRPRPTLARHPRNPHHLPLQTSRPLVLILIVATFSS